MQAHEKETQAIMFCVLKSSFVRQTHRVLHES